MLSFDEELKRGESSIPFILSRMTVAVSTVLKEHQITLSAKESDQLDDLYALLQIRYGY
ncbi:hypothetical protein MP619_05060 [Streptococcus dysgalactiae]|uniref:Uncharacterized protein n=1 Tax=Streptococcus dysgalactiae TaxID=1334 RepID=A0AAE9UP05_STRDY|nr:hypothetical protein [Streptococcus dysgalactiae]WAI93969.1 hypothetical protein MP619_05060 [Streptococcus dysgalactiae]